MLPSIWSARILAKLEKNLVFAQPGVVNRDYEGDIRADGDRVHIHSFNDLTVSSYTKNSTTITYENLTDSYIAGLYSGASTSSPDNTIETSQFTSTNVYQKFVDLAVLMDQVNLPADGRYVVVPPWVKGLLLQNSTFVTASKPDAVLNGQIGQIAGLNILV